MRRIAGKPFFVIYDFSSYHAPPMFWQTHPDAEEPLRAWHSVVRREQGRIPVDICADYASASFVMLKLAICVSLARESHTDRDGTVSRNAACS